MWNYYWKKYPVILHIDNNDAVNNLWWKKYPVILHIDNNDAVNNLWWMVLDNYLSLIHFVELSLPDTRVWNNIFSEQNEWTLVSLNPRYTDYAIVSP